MPILIRPSERPELLGKDWFEVVNGSSTFLTHIEQFSAITDKAAIHEMARHALSQIVIETSSYCNRTCLFCPNKDGIRLHKQYMDKPIYNKILEDLKAIDFSGSVLLHLYNEPLADDHIFDYIASASELLPNARIGLNTNGDYLDADILRQLVDSGLKQLTVSIYGRNPGHFNVDHIQERMADLVAKLGLVSVRKLKPLDFRSTIEGLHIRIFGQDFLSTGYDRGGLLDVGIQKSRKSPCPSPFKEILIGYDGKVVPCCNVHPSSDAHSRYIIDTVTADKGILEIFASEQHASWRRNLLRYQRQTGPCATCTRQECGEVSDAEVQEYNLACQDIFGQVSE